MSLILRDSFQRGARLLLRLHLLLLFLDLVGASVIWGLLIGCLNLSIADFIFAIKPIGV